MLEPAQTRIVPERRKANKAEAAAWFEVGLPSINNWIQRGCPVIQQGRKGQQWIIDLKAMHEWHLRKTGLFGTENEHGQIDPETMIPKDRLDWYRGTRERTRHMEEAGELIPAARFEAEMARVLKTVAIGLESLPDVLERDAGITGAAVERAQAIIDRMRDELHAKLIEVDPNASV
jgi:phage terminase Nu1 subunit (DNA packaging protein)